MCLSFFSVLIRYSRAVLSLVKSLDHIEKRPYVDCIISSRSELQLVGADESGGGSQPHEAAVMVNNAETSGVYLHKLRQEIERAAMELFTGAAERERVKSCLADLSKTSSDFHTMAAKAGRPAPPPLH
jgi:hypothetical protein